MTVVVAGFGLDPLFPSSLWSIKLEEDQLRRGALRNYRADVFWQGELKCRIAIAGHFDSLEAAQAAVAPLVRQWFVDCESRAHQPNSSFETFRVSA